jgi:general secretion pathway protein C
MRINAGLVASVDRLETAVATANARSRTLAPPATSGLPPASRPSLPADRGILKVGETQYLVERRLMDQVFADAGRVCDLRIVPESKHGRIVGVRLFGVRPDSPLGLLGFENGDRVESVDGIKLSAPERALEAYARFRNSDHVRVIVTRRGVKTLLEYHIV